ncbi:hypothetical protein [Chryseobacterium culicis]|uniref:hypothetical protein n=1 Tax=Chryseobacterium culicis TaxID=680127 RepID=UPI00289971E2|nr:hypothetical protein [Chryseobacterium culicis]
MKSFLITAAVFFGICFIYILTMLSVTENNFTYIVDDAYIHMAVAKNFALHGVWGMTKYAFSSSSSSPVFTFILSFLIAVFGNHILIPLIFNLSVACLLIAILTKYFSGYLSEAKHIIAACLFALFLAVMHVQVVAGMEHVLQVLIIAVNIYCFQKWFEKDFKSNFFSLGFYGTILFLGLIRFESMFYFLSLAFVFLLIRKFKDAFLVLLIGFLPILLFGYFNQQHSGYFFPNSVVVKGALIDFSGNVPGQIGKIILWNVFLNITFYKIGVFPLLIIAVLLYRDYKSKLVFQEMLKKNFLPVVLALTLILHCLLGDVKIIFRYEAYLMVAFVMVLVPRLTVFITNPFYAFRKDKATGIFIAANALLLLYKFGFAHFIITSGSANIYEQQIQSARFLKKYYNTSHIVANDIGAICYYTDIHLLDVIGLGSKEMVDIKVRKTVFDDEVEEFLAGYTKENHYQLAIVYEKWFDGHIPESWKKIADLEVSGKSIVLGDRHVVIYSIDPLSSDALKKNIKDFNWNRNVTVKIVE